MLSIESRRDHALLARVCRRAAQPFRVIQVIEMQSRTLVIYHYFEKNVEYAKNLAHFLLFGWSADCDYLVVVAGAFAAELPKRDNVRYLFTENRNNDYGGFCAAIEALGDGVAHYDHVLFVNASVRGPFLPPFSTRPWHSVFIERLCDEVGLVGSTINILSDQSAFARLYRRKFGGEGPVSHVQTLAYAMPIAVLQRLRQVGFYRDRPLLDKAEVIAGYELRLSRLVLENGWNITALLPEYSTIDYRTGHGEINPTSEEGDAHCALAYFGRSPHPFETIFIKTNRGIFNDEYLDRLAFSALRRETPTTRWENGALIERYVALLEATATSTERAPSAQEHYTAQKILQLTGILIEQHPESAVELQRILARTPPR
jgi:hypothetical protein